jgi:cell division protein FtsX
MRLARATIGAEKKVTYSNNVMDTIHRMGRFQRRAGINQVKARQISKGPMTRVGVVSQSKNPQLKRVQAVIERVHKAASSMKIHALTLPKA